MSSRFPGWIRKSASACLLLIASPGPWVADAVAESHLVDLTVAPSTQLSLSWESITHPLAFDDTWGVGATIAIARDDEHGETASSISFEPGGRTYTTGTSFGATVITQYGPFFVDVDVVDWFAEIQPADQGVAAAAVGQNQSVFELSTLRYVIVDGQTVSWIEALELQTVVDHATDPYEYQLSGSGLIEIVPHRPSRSATASVTIPISDEVDGFLLQGDLVLTGAFPLEFVELPIGWPVALGSALSMLASGRFARSWRAAGGSQSVAASRQ